MMMHHQTRHNNLTRFWCVVATHVNFHVAVVVVVVVAMQCNANIRV